MPRRVSRAGFEDLRCNRRAAHGAAPTSNPFLSARYSLLIPATPGSSAHLNQQKFEKGVKFTQRSPICYTDGILSFGVGAAKSGLN